VAYGETGWKPNARRASDQGFTLSCNGTKRKFSLLSRAAVAATATATLSVAPIVTAGTPAHAATVAKIATTSSTAKTSKAKPKHRTVRMSAAARHIAYLHWVRVTALTWAYSQRGKYYCYGGTGPYCYDCSGLVFSAYEHAGVWLGRSTYDMLADPRLRFISASQARPGDLAFFGSGHVELVSGSGTYGALDYGSPVWWHFPNAWFYPTMYATLR